MFDPADGGLAWLAMKRFVKRLVETGAICWLGMGALLVMGGFAAMSAHTVISSTEVRKGPPPVTVSSHDAAIFWFLVAALMIWIGVVAMRLPPRKN